MQGLKNKYPAFSSLISIAEHSKKETSSISRDTSTSATNVQLIKIKVEMWNAKEFVPLRTCILETRTYGFSRVIQIVNPLTFVLFKLSCKTFFVIIYIDNLKSKKFKVILCVL